MDFMKVFDQTVREIKREVNLKVLKVPEIEQKVLDATDDAPWGPHGTTMAEIAQATKKFTECQMVMNVLWTRLGETGKDWRLVYKALTVIEYLVAHGSERAVDDIIEHTFQISSLASFEYVEPSGKDVGLNVRKKAESITSLLNDKDKIQETRNKATANRDKYVGLSSSGITYKSGSASFNGGGGFQSSNRYDSFRDSYKDRDHYGEEKDAYRESRTGATCTDDGGNNLNNYSSRFSSKDQNKMSVNASKSSSKINLQNKSVSSQHSSAQSSYYKDEFDDDFDPRGTSSSNGLIGDLMDAPSAVSSEQSAGNVNEVDLFADAAFVSASTQFEKESVSKPQAHVDLFSSGPTIPPAASPVDLFSTIDVDPVVQLDTKARPSESTNDKIFDPFAAVPLNNFDGSDLVGAFSSSSSSTSAEQTQSSANDGTLENLNMNASDSKPQTKDAHKVKSGIWADSISRGLIDLNISAPKKVSLVDVGVVGDLGVQDEKKGPPTSFYMGRAMGTGSSLSKPGFTSSQSSVTESKELDDDFFSSLSSQQYQFGSFQK